METSFSKLQEEKEERQDQGPQEKRLEPEQEPSQPAEDAGITTPVQQLQEEKEERQDQGPQEKRLEPEHEPSQPAEDAGITTPVQQAAGAALQGTGTSPQGPTATPWRPSTASQRPTATRQRPTATRQRPTATPQRPSATPQRPSATPQRPIATPQRPTATPQRLSVTPQRPSATPQRPTATPQRPTATPRRPSTASQRPTATPQRPTATRQRPTATPQGPTATPQRPSATPQRPSATPQRPTATPHGPTATPLGPTATPQRPSATRQRPAATLQRPAATRQRPAATSQGPAATLQRPTATSKGPAATPQRPSTATQRPTATPQRPTATPQRPTATRQRPTVIFQGPAATPQIPSTATQRPTAAPQGPSATPQGPSATPQRSTATPQGPTATPQRPTVTPQGPSATPQGPSATPQGPSATPPRPSATPPRPSATPQGPSATPQGPSATPQGPAVIPTSAHGASAQSTGATTPAQKATGGIDVSGVSSSSSSSTSPLHPLAEEFVPVQVEHEGNEALRAIPDVPDTSAMAQFLHAWFPDLESKSYIIPSLAMGTRHADEKQLPSQTVEVLKLEADIKADHNDAKDIALEDVQKRVHACMMELMEGEASRNEVMIILLPSNCSMYRGVVEGAADMSEIKFRNKCLFGISDLVVINQDYGILIVAMTTETGSDREELLKNLREAITYLNEANPVTCCVLQNIQGGTSVKVHKALLLPNLHREDLTKLLHDGTERELLEELQQCLDVESVDEIMQACLCKDDMENKDRQAVWWSFTLKRNGPSPINRVYRQVVEMFFPPVTTTAIQGSRKPRLNLWNKGQAVKAVADEFGREMTKLALYPNQFDILSTPSDDKDDFRYLCGAPGTGKTVMLLLKGAKLLNNSSAPVIIMITNRSKGLASACLIQHQLIKTAKLSETQQRVEILDCYEDDEREATVQKLLDVASTSSAINILADEAKSDVVTTVYSRLKQELNNLTRITLWAAGVYHPNIPTDLRGVVTTHVLTEPLRSPPCVVREVEGAVAMKKGKVPGYSTSSVPCTDGPSPIVLQHYSEDCRDRRGHQGSGLYHDFPWRCETCGHQVADTLVNKLHLGDERDGPTPRDIFVLGANIDADETDDDKFSPTPFIRGMRQRGVPTRGVSYSDREAVRELAVGSGPDTVTVTDEDTVWGLERPLVVFLDTESRGVEWGNADVYGRLRSVSRCTSQLVWVERVHH